MNGLHYVESSVFLECVARVEASAVCGDRLKVEAVGGVAGEVINVILCKTLVRLDAPVPLLHVARDPRVGRSKRFVHWDVMAHVHGRIARPHPAAAAPQPARSTSDSMRARAEYLVLAGRVRLQGRLRPVNHTHGTVVCRKHGIRAAIFQKPIVYGPVERRIARVVYERASAHA